MRRIDYIAVHCSATRPSQNLGVSWLRRLHVEQNRWSDVGYHYVITRDGKIQTGRPEERMGAHVKGFNAHSIGICLIGGLDDAGDISEGFDATFTMEQERALRRLWRLLTSKYPDAEWKGHRDFSPDVNHDGEITPNEWLKNCPCFNVSDLLPYLSLPERPSHSLQTGSGPASTHLGPPAKSGESLESCDD